MTTQGNTRANRCAAAQGTNYWDGSAEGRLHRTNDQEKTKELTNFLVALTTSNSTLPRRTHFSVYLHASPRTVPLVIPFAWGAHSPGTWFPPSTVGLYPSASLSRRPSNCSKSQPSQIPACLLDRHHSICSYLFFSCPSLPTICPPKSKV